MKTSEGYYQYVRHAMDARTVGRLVCLDSNSRLTSNGCLTVTLNTDQVTEGSGNLYFTQARVRAALSALAPLIFNSSTGQFSMPVSNSVTNGYLAATDWVAFNAKAGTGTCPGGQAVTQTTTAGVTCASVSSLPSQTGNAGKYLTTDGTNASWGTVAAGGYSTAKVSGVSQTQRANINFAVGSGNTVAGSDDGTNTTITIGSDTSVLLTRATAQSGVDQYCASASASGTAYTCTTPGTALSAYTNGMTRVWKPDVAGGTNPTLAVDGLAAKRIYASDGTSAPTITANNAYLLTYDSSLNSAAGGWRMPAGGGSSWSKFIPLYFVMGSCSTGGGPQFALWETSAALACNAGNFAGYDLSDNVTMIRQFQMPDNWDGANTVKAVVSIADMGFSSAGLANVKAEIACVTNLGTTTYNGSGSTVQVSIGTTSLQTYTATVPTIPISNCSANSLAKLRITKTTTSPTATWSGSYYRVLGVTLYFGVN